LHHSTPWLLHHASHSAGHAAGTAGLLSLLHNALLDLLQFSLRPLHKLNKLGRLSDFVFFDALLKLSVVDAFVNEKLVERFLFLKLRNLLHILHWQFSHHHLGQKLLLKVNFGALKLHYDFESFFWGHHLILLLVARRTLFIHGGLDGRLHFLLEGFSLHELLLGLLPQRRGNLQLLENTLCGTGNFSLSILHAFTNKFLVFLDFFVSQELLALQNVLFLADPGDGAAESLDRGHDV